MTHLLNQWQRPVAVGALQITSLMGKDLGFDVHPSHRDPQWFSQMVAEFNLPHEPKFLQQVHGADVIEWQHPPAADFLYRADACYTRADDVICAVMTADCLPILLTDDQASFVAALHGGWRSLAAGIIGKTLEAINPVSPVLAWLGPCIQTAQYEVDQAFVKNYLNQHPLAESAFTPVVNGKSHASLQTMATLQLKQHGIKAIQQDSDCTYLHPQYHSWRQNQTHARMATLVWKSSSTQPA